MTFVSRLIDRLHNWRAISAIKATAPVVEAMEALDVVASDGSAISGDGERESRQPHREERLRRAQELRARR